MKALIGVLLRVRPEPGALLVCLVVLYSGAQDENGFSASCLPADKCRMVQSAGGFCRLSQLDGHSFASILYTAATAMKPVIIGFPEVKPQSERRSRTPRERRQRDKGLLPPLPPQGGFSCWAMLQITSSPHPTSDRLASPD